MFALSAKLTSNQGQIDVGEELMKQLGLLTDSRAAINIGFDLSVVPVVAVVPPVRKVALAPTLRGA